MSPNDFQDELNKREAEQKSQQEKQAEINAINKAGIKNVEATNANTKSTAKGLKDVRGKVQVTNPDLAKSQDVGAAVDAIHKLNLTTFNTNQGLPQLADNLVKLTTAVQALQKDYETKGVSGLSKQLETLVGKLDGVSKTLSNSKVEVDSGLQKTIDNLQKSIEGINFNPTVNVKAPAAKVVTTPVDFKLVLDALAKVEQAITDAKPDNDQLDLTPVTTGLSDVQNAIQALRFPVPNFVLPFKDSNGKDVQVQLDASGNLPTTGGGGTASSVAINDGTTTSTKASVLNSSVTAGINGIVVLNPDGTNISGGSGGGSTQYADGAVTPTHPTGTIPVYDNAGAIASVSTTNRLPVAATGTVTANAGTGTFAISAAALPLPSGAATAAKQPALGTAGSASSDVLTVQGISSMTALKVDGSAVTQPVSGTVTANAGTNLNTSALALETGGNLASIKTDADNLNLAQGSTTSGQKGNLTLGAVTTAAPTYTTAQSNPLSLTTSGLLRVDGSGSTQPISGSVTANAGTNLNTSALALDATLAGAIKAEDAASADGDKGIPALAVRKATPANTSSTDGDYENLQVSAGRLWVDASGRTLTVDGSSVTQPVSFAQQALVAGSAIIGKVGIDQTTDGTTNKVFVGNIPHVIVDTAPSTAVTNAGTFAVQATLSAETTKVIGTVRTADGSGNLYSSNSSTYTAKFAQDGNLLGTLGTAFSTAGKVDVKAADGDVFVRQATASNLNATVVGNGTFSVQTSAQVPGTGATNLGKAEDAAASSGDTGVFALGVRNDAAATVTTNANGDYSQLSVDSTGTVFVRQAPNNTATESNVAASATSVTALAANTSRRNFVIYNDSTSDCYVKYGTAASATSFTYYLPSLGTLQDEFYAGRIDVIHLSATGNLRVTEITI